eukprot:981239_1
MMQHEDEEIESLMVETSGVSSRAASPSKLSRIGNVKGNANSKGILTSSNIKKVLILVLLIGIVTSGNKLASNHFSALGESVLSSPKNSSSSSSSISSSTNATSIPKITCPSDIEPSKNDFDAEDGSISAFYEKDQKSIKKESLTLDDVEALKKKNYDGWAGNFFK